MSNQKTIERLGKARMAFIESLESDYFKDTVLDILTRCYDLGVVMLPFYGRRSLDEQARLWRSSRKKEAVEKEIENLLSKKCDFLAHVIQRVGPQKTGAHKTNAIPGFSWHNHGLAIDCFWEEQPGKANWASDGTGYRVYSSVASSKGLTCGYLWGDAVHIQKEPKEVRHHFSLKEINDKFEAEEKNINNGQNRSCS